MSTAMPRCKTRKLMLFGACTLSFLFCGIFGALKLGESPNVINVMHDSSEVAHEYFDIASAKNLLGADVSNRIQQLQCGLLFQSGGAATLNNAKKRAYLAQYKKRRLEALDPPADKFIGNCDEIRRRWNFAKDALSEEERQFPIAFARTIFRDYNLIEEMLGVEYQPQNVYCYSLDAKTDSTFKNRVRNLTKCFENVIVPDVEYSVASNGKNVTRSHLSCLRAMRDFSKQKTPWKYAILLQNHDIPLKTTREMIKILKILNGTNDLSTAKVVPISIQKDSNWTFANLHLYNDNAKNTVMLEREQNSTLKTLQHTKSLVLAELSRAAVDFMLDQLKLDGFVDQLERSTYGMDEVAVSTLNSNLPDFPGGFTPRCLYEENRPVYGIGRYTVWQRNVEQCKSGKFRHVSCVFGVEDLEHLASYDLTQLYLNKMMPAFDYGAISCWLRRLKRRTLEASIKIDMHVYQNLPHVRYNRFKSEKKGEKEFECR